MLDADPYAVRKDLPDLTRFLLGTGVRIGEAMGVTWNDVDLATQLVHIRRTVIRVKGVGLVPKVTQSRAGLPVSPLEVTNITDRVRPHRIPPHRQPADPGQHRAADLRRSVALVPQHTVQERVYACRCQLGQAQPGR